LESQKFTFKVGISKSLHLKLGSQKIYI